MLKPIVMITVFIVCSLFGNSFAVRLKRRIDGIEELLAGVRHIGTMMRFQRKPLTELILNLSKSRTSVLWEELSTHLKCNGFRNAWDIAIHNASEKEHKLAALTTPELTVMLDLAAELGRSDLISQQRQLKLAESALEELLSQVIQKQQCCAKPYRTLGVAVGIVCAILIW